jgi:hypothetical protein
MPRLSLGLGVQTVRKVGSAAAIPQSGLSLWLKADAGINKLSVNYATQIIISGTSTPNFNGTYTATGVPGISNDYPGIVDYYVFSGPSGRSMFWEPSEQQYRVFLNGSGNSGGFASFDGITWSQVEIYIGSIALTGFTGDYAGANGTYTATSPNSGEWGNINGYYILDDGVLYDEGSLQIAYNYNGYTGSWTLINGTGSPTSTTVTVPSGSISGSVTTSTINTNYVTSWQDQSGNNRNAGIIYNFPTYTPVAINNKPAILFSDDALRLLSFSNTGFYPKTIFVVGTASEDQAYRTMVGGNSDGIVGNYYVQTRAGISQPSFTLGNIDETSYVAFANALTANTPYILGGYSDFLTSVNAFKNGVVGSSVAVSDVQRNITTGYIGGGYYDGGPADFWNGYIAEVIMYNRVLTITERQQVEAYLNTKYAIY